MPKKTEYLEGVLNRPALVTYNLDPDESVIDGLTTAFDAVGYDLSTKEPPLIQFLDPAIVDDLRKDNTDFCLVTLIWEHPVSITSNTVSIHASEDESNL